MNRTTKLYRFLKKCESPPDNNRLWLFISTVYNISMLVLGRIVLRLTCKHEESYILVAPFSMGDALLLYRIWGEMLDTNAIENPTILAEKSLIGALSKLGLTKNRELSPWKIITMSKAILFSPERYPKIVLSQAWHFLDIRQLHSKNPLQSLPCSLTEETKKILFPDSHMKGKCIILSPYEKTYLALGEKQIPMFFWETLAEGLLKKGYHVFTNCDGEKEPAIKHTKVFFPPLLELAGALDYAGNCICVRSGFVDWANSTSVAKQIVLYPSENFLAMFSMEAVWEKRDVKEIVYDLSDLSLLKNKLLSYFKTVEK